MKVAIRIFLILLAAVIFSSVFAGFKSNDSFSGTIFSISGIVFSLGISLITAFNYSHVKNEYYIKYIRRNLNKVRNWFVFFFAITVLCYVLDYYFRSREIVSFVFVSTENFKVELNYSMLLCITIIYSIFYYFVNFKALQNLRDDTFNEALKEEEKKEEWKEWEEWKKREQEREREKKEKLAPTDNAVN